VTPTPARGHRSPGSSHRRALFAGLALLLVALVAAFARAIVTIDAPPRSMAPYIERRLAGHHPLLVRSGAWLARFLTALDRGESRTPIRLSLRAGAQQEASPLPPPSAVANRVGVASPEQALRAIGRAQPGDVIILEPGTYRFSGASIFIRQAGTPDAGITVRASRPRTVFIEMDNLEGFVVSAPYWRFENLTIRGVCARHSECDHAFHVVGAATHFVARNNTLIDFNAHIKVNGEGRHFPDDGLIEGNTLSDSAVRQTESPVTTVDLVAASRWTVRGNLITDFIKAGGDRISYGAFAKGGGSGNRFERNVVLCEYLLRGAPGSRVGISLGGGGTAREYCRDGACVVEQDGGSVESNLIASCSDDGIYVNRSAQSRIVHNTLIDTGGIVVRFAESSADVEGNLVDGAIRSRDGGLLHADDNLQTDLSALYFGYHPQRRLFRDALALDLAWATKAPRRASPSPPPTDLCESTRPPQPVYGAFEGIEACLGAATEVGR
jgi:parallel beta-helix repeat protein